MATSGTTSNLPASGSGITGQEQTLASWAAPYITDTLARTMAVTDRPYETYQGPLTAGPSTLQNKAFTGLESLNFPTTLGKSFTDTGIASSYMNPYMQQILQPQMQALQRQADIDRNKMKAQAAKLGAFGGARSDLMNAQLNAELMRQQQQTTGKAYENAFAQALGQFNAEQNQAMGILNAINAAGTAQRNIEEEGIKADLNEFEKQRDWDWLQLQRRSAMLQGLPISATNYETQQPSDWSQLLGGAAGLEELYKRLFPSTTTPATTPPK